MIPRVRRIVTGHAADGRSVVATDGPATVVLENYSGNPGLYFSEIWRTSGGVPPVGNGPDPTGEDFSLAAGNEGTNFRLVDFPASRRDPNNTSAADPGDSVSPMHRTQSVDYGIVLSGRMRLILTDQELALESGDIVIQRGTDHAWANRSGAPARMAFILITGRFTDEILPFAGEVTS